MKIVRIIITALSLLVGCHPAPAQTAVDFQPLYFTGATNRMRVTVDMVDELNPYVDGTHFIIDNGPLEFWAPATTNLLPGVYVMSVQGVRKRWQLTIDDTTNLVNAASPAVAQQLPLWYFSAASVPSISAGTNIVVTVSNGVTTVSAPNAVTNGQTNLVVYGFLKVNVTSPYNGIGIGQGEYNNWLLTDSNLIGYDGVNEDGTPHVAITIDSVGDIMATGGDSVFYRYFGSAEGLTNANASTLFGGGTIPNSRLPHAYTNITLHSTAVGTTTLFQDETTGDTITYYNGEIDGLVGFHFVGALFADQFIGSGYQLTLLNASALTSGTIPYSVIPTGLTNGLASTASVTGATNAVSVALAARITAATNDAATATAARITAATNDAATATAARVTAATNDLNSALTSRVTTATNDLATATATQLATKLSATNLVFGTNSTTSTITFNGSPFRQADIQVSGATAFTIAVAGADPKTNYETVVVYVRNTSGAAVALTASPNVTTNGTLPYLVTNLAAVNFTFIPGNKTVTNMLVIPIN